MSPAMTQITLPCGPDAFTEQLVLYCNHKAVFEADVIVTAFSVVIIAKKIERGNVKLFFKPDMVKAANWHILDDKLGAYWRPDKGRFVLPRDAVKRFL